MNTCSMKRYTSAYAAMQHHHVAYKRPTVTVHWPRSGRPLRSAPAHGVAPAACRIMAAPAMLGPQPAAHAQNACETSAGCLLRQRSGGGEQAYGTCVDITCQQGVSKDLLEHLNWRGLAHEGNVNPAPQRGVGLLCRWATRLAASKHKVHVCWTSAQQTEVCWPLSCEYEKH